MIKPLEEYSPKPKDVPAPFSWQEVDALLARIPQEDRDEFFEQCKRVIGIPSLQVLTVHRNGQVSEEGL